MAGSVAEPEPDVRVRRRRSPSWSRQGCCTRSASGSSGVKTDPHDPGRDPIGCTATSARRSRSPAPGKSYVLTTGTGSGKSLAYIVPIVDAVLRETRRDGGRRPGVKAIVVYPMNALAN